MKKSTRTISGVTPVAVMTLPMKCPGQCIYCPTYPMTPQSYTPESPVVLRARKCNYDTKKQVELRLRILSDMGHPTDKVDLIVMGGTFLANPLEYQDFFVKNCLDGITGETSTSLSIAKRNSEYSVQRNVGITFETRPDYCKEDHVN